MNNAQECLNKLCDELLGEDYYIESPVGVNQGNEIITDTIIELYKKDTNMIVKYITKTLNAIKKFISISLI